MHDAYLIPLPIARHVRLAHNENRSQSMTVGEYVRLRGLKDAFPSRTELRRALQTAEVWTMTVERFDQSQVHSFAASRLPVLLLHATGQPVIDIGRWDDRLPPLPRHDWGLVLECEVDQGGEKNWALTWGEVDPLLRHRMRSRSLHLLVARALETSIISAQSTAANWAWESRLN